MPNRRKKAIVLLNHNGESNSSSKEINGDNNNGGATIILYADVKQKFLRLAMSTHPDTSNPETEEEEEANRELFLAARRAFESIVEGPDGTAVLRKDSDQAAWEEDELGTWFEEETGLGMPFMTANQHRRALTLALVLK